METPDTAVPNPSPDKLNILKERGKAVYRSRRVRRWVGGFVLAFILFGILGYLWLPGFVHSRLETALSEQLHHPVHLEKIEIQPYALEVTLGGLSIGNKEGEGKLAGFETLTLNFSTASIWKRGVVLDSLHLQKPYVNLVRHADGSFNVTDIVDQFLNKKDDQESIHFALNDLKIMGGHITLDDQGSKSQHEISDIDLVLPRLSSFSSEAEHHALPHFSANLDGAPINLKGEVRPYASTQDGILKIHFKNLDLARLASFSPIPLPVKIQSAKLDSDMRLGYSMDDKSQISLEGHANLHGVQASLPRLSVGMEQFSLKIDAPNLGKQPIVLENLNLKGLSGHRSDEDQPFLTLAEAQLDKVTLDTVNHQLQIGKMGLTQPLFKVIRNTQEHLDILDTMAQIQTSTASSPSKKTPSDKSPSEKAPPTAPAWAWNVQGLTLSGGEFKFVDQSVPKAIPLELQGLNLEVGQIASSGNQPIALKVESKLNGKGSLSVAGNLNPSSNAGELELNVDSLDLVPLQGWVPRHMNMVLTDGDLTTQGKLKFGGTPFGVHYQGSGRLENLNLLDRPTAQTLARWKKLELSGLDLNTAPLMVKLDEVALSKFFARLVVTPQGNLYLDQLLQEPGTGPVKPTPATPSVTEVAATLPGEANTPVTKVQPEPEQVKPVATRSAPLPVQIGRIRLDDGSVIFNDQFIKPNYTANLTGLSGSMGPLAAGKRGTIKLQGKVNRVAPLIVTGELEPFSKELFLNVKAQARGIDMPNFNPYSGRYAGYLIQKGKLSVDVSYHIENGQLEANNHIFLDQLTLGEKVESPDAISIPLTLALALLKNNKGEIDIDLPISGSIDDPQFSVGGIVIKAVVNLLVKAVTAPFTLLGSLFGGGEELSYVEFNSGATTLGPESEKRLQTLAKALTERQALTLEITGSADQVADSEGYRRVLLERQVKAKKIEADTAQGKSAASIREVSLTPQEYEKYLTQLYKEAKFEKPKNMIGLNKGLPVSEMENLLVTHMELNQSSFNDLADRRARVVQDWLVTQGKIPLERLFVMAPAVSQGDPANPGNRVIFGLR